MAYKIPALPYACPERHSHLQVATVLQNIPNSKPAIICYSLLCAKLFHSSWVSHLPGVALSACFCRWAIWSFSILQPPSSVCFLQYLRTFFPCPIPPHGKNYLLNFITTSGSKDGELRAVENMHIFYRQGFEVLLGCKSSKNSSAARLALLTCRDADERWYKSCLLYTSDAADELMRV